MEFKKLLLFLSITMIIILILTFGVTYGWYAYSNAETTVEGETLDAAPNVVFTQTEYINSQTTMPILDNDRYNYGNKNSFTITIGEDLKDYEVGIEILLTGIKIDEELKNTNYKYELLQDGVSVATGDFSELGTENRLILTPMTVFNPLTYPQTYNYILYIWLSDDGSNQNNLINKNFSAKITVDNAIKK